MNPANIGVSKTRAMTCELLAIRLLKDYSTRELIDALSYDFDPLQGLTPPETASTTPRMGGPVLRRPLAHTTSARISTLEVAIRAQAKKFLAHPVVVQQLEAIWAGNIVFHSEADNLHRRTTSNPKRPRGYGTLEEASDRVRKGPSRKQPNDYVSSGPIVRRTVILYDPRDASLCKLSRLRVPNYRQIFSTVSFGMMLCLFLAVLIQKSITITPLEVVFWFWSAGYMLDEIVGFSEQGFGLYIMSVWNAFDLGILLLFVIYYILRLYGVLMSDSRRHYVANMAYDVLASTAVLLFPRLFSVLDHYRYFSQLLIAFRMMAMDLVAILVLIVISCSGFFVSITLSFGDDDFDAAGTAYALFQMLMGFTPAAWAVWDSYNLLGKAILTLFLFICHFLFLTILITVLTNSFMAIVQNANEEHQFLFAVNTISMVKSDALFSYIAPTNIIGWLLVPLQYVLPFSQFVRLNRTVIKITHFPILFCIFAYERLVLSHAVYDLTDLVEQRGRSVAKGPAFTAGDGDRPDLFSPGRRRIREPSVTTLHKDRALEEVFRHPYVNRGLRSANKGGSKATSSNVVHDWMSAMGVEGGAGPPQEQPRHVLDKLETRRSNLRRLGGTKGLLRNRLTSAGSKSAVSEPDEIMSRLSHIPAPIKEEEFYPDMSMDDLPQATDADGDDELVTNDEEDGGTFEPASGPAKYKDSDKENIDSSTGEREFQSPETVRRKQSHFSTSIPSPKTGRLDQHSETSKRNHPPTTPGRRRHVRNTSSTTILFNPLNESRRSSASSAPSLRRRATAPRTPIHASAGATTPDRRTPKRAIPSANRASRPTLPPRMFHQSVPNIAGVLATDRASHLRQPSFNARALDLASDLGDNRYGPDPHVITTMPASFSSHMVYAAGARERRSLDEDSGMMSRIMLARMKTLEEGFRDVVREVKEWRRDGSFAPSGAEDTSGKATRVAGQQSNRKDAKSKKSGAEKEKDELPAEMTESPADGQSNKAVDTSAAEHASSA